jgi:hypothetical protein
MRLVTQEKRFKFAEELEDLIRAITTATSVTSTVGHLLLQSHPTLNGSTLKIPGQWGDGDKPEHQNIIIHHEL